MKQISTLDRQIKSYSTSASNPLVRREGGRGEERKGEERRGERRGREAEERRGREGEERRGREGEERRGREAGRDAEERERGRRQRYYNNSLKWKRVESLVYFLQVHMVYTGKS